MDVAFETAEERVAEARSSGATKLDFRGIRMLANLPPLDDLPFLRSLTLRDTWISDLAPLSGLTSLQSLDLGRTPVSDLAPLAGLSSLQSLNLSDTQVSDLVPLASLTSLQSLGLNSTQVSDLAPLAGLTSLQLLFLSGTAVSDLAPLADLASLQSLFIEDTPVSDLAPLAGLTSLQSLQLWMGQVSDLGPIAGLTSMISLNLEGTPVSDLRPIAGLTLMISLKLGKAPVSDLAPLAHLSSLQSLDLSETKVTDLAPLAGLTSLQSLDLEGAQVSDLAPLARLLSLQSLDLSETQVTDLAPLAGLTSLPSLNLRETRVSDLAPLVGLTSLKSLNLSETQVWDLAPLAGLTSLRSLDLGGTKVSDLAPLANLVDLVTGARSSPHSQGISFTNCKVEDSILLSYADLENPERTVRTINYLRERRGLPRVADTDDTVKYPADKEESADPPILPAQGPGPHFAIGRNGVIDFAPPESLDEKGNQRDRLESLLPLLREAARNLRDQLGKGNIPHGHVLGLVEPYLDLVNRNLDEIDFAQLFGRGLRLENAASASKREIEARDLPELTDAQSEALDSVLQLHGPFILASHVGLELIAAAERYQRRPREEQEFQKHAVAFAKALKGSPEIVAPRVSEFVDESVKAIGTDPDLGRNAVLGSGASTNVTVALIAGATICLLPVAGGALADWMGASVAVGALPGGVLAFIGFESLKKTKALGDVTRKIADAIDDHGSKVAQWAGSLPHGTKRGYVEFILKNEATLRGMAGKKQSLRWIHAHLDWIKATAGHKASDDR